MIISHDLQIFLNFFSDLWTRVSRTFLLATRGHILYDIYMNRLVSTPSSALTSQKSKYLSRNRCILNTFRLIRPIWPKSCIQVMYTDSKSVKEFRSFEVYVIRIGQLGGALESFSGFCSFCSRAPPRDCGT